MKKIKVLGYFLLCCILLVSVLVFANKKDYSYYLAIGDYISKKQVLNDEEVQSFSNYLGDYLLDNKIVNEVNSKYLKNNMTSKNLLEMIEKDSYKNQEDSLVSLIKKSKYITITLGINDILDQIKYDSYSNKLLYDKDVVAHRIEIFKHNYHKIIEEIKDINSDSKVMLVGCYAIYGEEELVALINDAIQEVSDSFNLLYVDTSDMSDKYIYTDNELYLNEIGQEILSNKVISLINKIEKE